MCKGMKDDILNGSFGRRWLPYCFVRVEAPTRGKHIFIPVNRDYKPLGMPNGKWVDYEKFPENFVRFKNDPITIRGVWFQADSWRLWLYNDDPSSRANYGRRLQLVASRCRAAPRLERFRPLDFAVIRHAS